MIIVIEGADGSGKTTLYNQLKNCLSNSPEYKFITQPARGTVADIQFDFWLDLDNSINYIFDRSFITDIVYRMVDNGRTDMTLCEIDTILRHKPIQIIYCNTLYAYDYAMARGENNIMERHVHHSICDTYEFVLNILKEAYNIPVKEYSFDNEYNKLLTKLGIKLSFGGNNGV